ncbi:MAG: D-alanyl-D-alanine carboxypeptidase [Oscillospiraceae bacterium]|nr:D-alanyl-D-alanine carboxypeptidase [Oscillospiraceae bacterium]
MKKTRIFPLILALCLFFALTAPVAQALDAPELDAQAVILVDLDSGLILYEKNMLQERSPASLTKVMTLLLALEAVDRGEASLDDVVTAGVDCQQGMGDDSSSVYIVAGEQMTLRDLLYCAAVSSGNDACNVIASYLGNGISNFVDRMNDKAAALGCTASRFVDPNGLSNDDLSSAYDLYLITREAMRYPLFMEICDTISYTVPATNLNAARELKNSNALLTPDGIYGAGYVYEYASGIKTGYTRAAGYCLISTAEKDGVHLLGIVMGCPGPYIADTDTRYNFVDTAKLFDWAFENFSYRSVVTTEDQLASAYIAIAQSGGDTGLHQQFELSLSREEGKRYFDAVPLYPQRSLSVLMPGDVTPGTEDLRIALTDKAVAAPITAGTVLGEATVYLNGTPLGSVRLVAGKNIDLPRGEYLRMRLSAFFSNRWVVIILVVILVLLLAYLVLVIRYRRLRRKHLRQRKLAEQRRRELARQREEAAAREGEAKPFDEDLF